MNFELPYNNVDPLSAVFMRFSLVALMMLSAPAALTGQGAPGGGTPPGEVGARARTAPTAAAVRTAAPPQINGRLDDAAWAQAPVIGGFTQRDPVEGAPASEATEVRIIYDDEAIYIGARLRDASGPTSRLGRRDMQLTASDWFRVSFDSYHDRRTAFRFDVNPAGVRRDATLGGGASLAGGGGAGGSSFAGVEGDLAWDAVWDAETSVDADGWSVEMRIPFSQLRFAPAAEQLWGLQLERIINRNQELDLFAFTSKSEPGGVPAFGDLTGLRGVRPGRPLELMPYVLSKGEFEATGANPFVSDREVELNAGIDARYRITSNLTLSATINPDFGQVEVDPAIINLSAFETRLEEKRPFFVEGASSFRFGGNTLGPSAMAANLLYSRRLGRAPQVGISATASDVPAITDILGAVKLSGKTASGWSLGVLNAVTGEESGRFLDAQGERQRAVVEPLTNYFVGRVNRELRQGLTSVGGILTSVNRNLDDPRGAAILRSSAYTGGLDFTHAWARRMWSIGGFVVGSRVNGSNQAILQAQRSSTRYFQRPDAESLEVDPNATSLGGAAATVQMYKASGVHFTGDWWVSTITPGFEINDLGFQQRSDRIAFGGANRYTQRKPGPVLRSWSLTVIPNFAWNYDGDQVEKIVRSSLNMTHVSYWDLQLGGTYEPRRIDDRFTRGGPVAMRPATWSTSTSIDSDPRKPLAGTLGVMLQGDDAGSLSRAFQTLLSVRTSPRWNLSLGPRYQRVRQDAQFVATIPDPAMTSTFGARYVFAPLDQTELSLVTRLNYTFTPNLSLELYAQPLVSNAEYGTPKEFQKPAGYDFATYGTELGTLSRTGNRFVVDPDASGPIRSFSVPDRSFTTRSLRGNAVLRWEYRPGSTFYLVWQQERLNDDFLLDFDAAGATRSLFDAPASNVLVLKASYWLNP